ncbi:MAG: multicopper oxidase domain-containing protein [Flavobacteriales bacterium]
MYIPPLLEGIEFDLQVQSGTTQFFDGINTPTYGVNSNILAPTMVWHKGDVVTPNVTNNLNTTTTMHWHGLHVAPMFDGGPHQIIEPDATWSPQFEVMNVAGTYWYHPHGENKTDFQVSRGLAGMIIIKDEVEAALDLPRTYGVDDFPLIVQSKSFDELQQIQIATHADTVVMVNATINPSLDVPAQVVRLRLLNGSSDRSYLFGFSNQMNFYQIATDGGLKETPYETNRMRLSPGERAEILVNLNNMQSDVIYLMNFGSELPDGIIGAAAVGQMTEPDGYSDNWLNGADFNLLQLNIGEPTEDPITAIPSALVTITPISVDDVTVIREINLVPMESGMDSMVEGPFGINNVQFDMEVINETVMLNATEIWTLNNQTQVAHPFHIHDVEFQVLDYNGDTPPADQQGWKDVVLVMPMQSVSFIAKFEHFADPMTPYMYHCHLLHHEDEGMMGSFLVIDPDAVNEYGSGTEVSVFPNPATSTVTIQFNDEFKEKPSIHIFDSMGKSVEARFEVIDTTFILDIENLTYGLYSVCVNGKQISNFIKE